jgi:hypothetical protein
MNVAPGVTTTASYPLVLAKKGFRPEHFIAVATIGVLEVSTKC